MKNKNKKSKTEGDKMKLLMFSIFDTKVGAYGLPFFLRSNAEAIRMFVELGSSMDNMIAKHPEDFILFKTGEYTDNDGVVTNCAPVNLGVAASFLANRYPGEGVIWKESKKSLGDGLCDSSAATPPYVENSKSDVLEVK